MIEHSNPYLVNQKFHCLINSQPMFNSFYQNYNYSRWPANRYTSFNYSFSIFSSFLIIKKLGRLRQVCHLLFSVLEKTCFLTPFSFSPSLLNFQWAGEVISSREKTTVHEEFWELEKDIELRRDGVHRSVSYLLVSDISEHLPFGKYQGY